MENKKVTAVEWMYEEIYNEYKISIHDGIMDKAKEMEKEQKENDLIDFAQWYSGMDRGKVINAYKRYQKETFKSE